MAVISRASYITISTNYSDARTQVLGGIQFLFDAVYNIVLLTEVQPSVDLLSEFYNGYQINSNIWKSPVTMLSAVRALNNHVLSRGGFADLDEYFEEAEITVPQTWADLCASAGFPVSDVYIE